MIGSEIACRRFIFNSSSLDERQLDRNVATNKERTEYALRNLEQDCDHVGVGIRVASCCVMRVINLFCKITDCPPVYAVALSLSVSLSRINTLVGVGFYLCLCNRM